MSRVEAQIAAKVVIVLDRCGLSAGVHRFWPALKALEVANATTPRSEVWAASWSSLLRPEA